jgi:hypothetical protein
LVFAPFQQAYQSAPASFPPLSGWAGFEFATMILTVVAMNGAMPQPIALAIPKDCREKHYDLTVYHKARMGGNKLFTTARPAARFLLFWMNVIKFT